MFNWVVKVVPQPPPGGPGALGEDTTKPAAGGKDGKKSSDEESSEERNRVINWVAQSLTQSLTRAGLPQPDEKYREKPFEDVEHTEVFEVNQLPDYDPLPHIPVVEMESDEEIDMESLHPTQQVVNWIKQAMPQPAHLPGAIETSPRPPKRSTTSLDKVVSPPPQSLSGISLDTDDKAGVVGWFRSGLGLRMPQLVIKPKDESPTAADVLQKASADMVLEDVDSDNEGQLKAEASQPLRSVSAASASAASASAASMQPALRSVSSERSAAQPSEPEPPAAAVEDEVDDTPAAGEPPATQTVGTDTGRWTPFIDSIKKEAEGVAMATMEERLLEERAEMARLAEDVARQAAERAIKELAEEGSIKLSLGSRELLDEEDQPGEAPEPDAELQEVPQEETELQEVPQEETELQELPQEETELQEVPQKETELQEVPQEELGEADPQLQEVPQEELGEADPQLQRLPIEPPEEGSEEADAEPDPSSAQSESTGGVSSVIRFCTHRSHSEAKCRIAIVTTSVLPPEPEPVDPQEEEKEEEQEEEEEEEAAAEEPTPADPSEPTKSSGDQEPEEEEADGAGAEAVTEAEADPEPVAVVTQQPQKADQASLAATVSADASSAANKEEERSGEVGCESSGSCSPAVNVEDVDSSSDHKAAAAAAAAEQVLSPQDSTANMLTVPGPQTGGRHSW